MSGRLCACTQRVHVFAREMFGHNTWKRGSKGHVSRCYAQDPPLILKQRLFIPLALALLVTLANHGVGLAHSNLERSDPASGAILRQAPADVRLWFTEDLEPRFSRAVVYDANRRAVSVASRVAPDNPRLLVVGLEPALARGWYVISWQAQAKLDGHLTRGTISFGIGVTGPPPGIATAADTAASGSGSPFEVVLRWLILLSAIALVGSFAFWLIESWTIVGGSTTAKRIRILPAQWALAELAWMSFMLANVVFLTNAVAVVSDASSLDDLGPPLVQLATQTTFGQIWLARMALASVLGLILLGRGHHCPSSWDGIALGTGALLLFSFSATSHSAALTTLAPVAVAIDWLHFAAVTIWVGGLLQLAVLLAAFTRNAAGLASADVRWDVVRRFGAVATSALTIVAVTGLFEALYHVGTPFNLVHTGYGLVVALKMLLIIPLVAVAGLQRTVLRSMRGGKAIRMPPLVSRMIGTRRLDSWLASSVRVEALLAVIVIAVVGLLTSLSPP
jgi:copper transport protein